MVTGSTVEVRQAARARKSAKSRVEHFGHRIRSAATGARRLAEAFDYLRAVADDLSEGEKQALVREIVRLADERNKR